jgi:hypothetical protein
MAPSLNGVAHVAVITDPIACGRMVGGKLMPLLLPGLGVPSLQVVGVITGGVTAISSCRRGAHIGAVPVDGGCRLGQPGVGSTALGKPNSRPAARG